MQHLIGGPRLFLRALLAFLALPGMVAFVVPLAILRRPVLPDSFAPEGVAVVAVGVVVLLWCVRDFYVAGRGTLAPWSPPLNLVVVGLYKYSRNPMYVGVMLIVIGWALGFRSSAHWIYAAFLAIAFHVRVVVGEEPFLERTHGDDWVRYKASVSRWFICAVLLSLVGPISLRAQTARPPRTARIVGTVIDSASARPVLRAIVCSHVETYDKLNQNICVNPESLGKFVLAPLPAGMNIFTVECAPRRLGNRIVGRNDTLTLGDSVVRSIDIRFNASSCDMRPLVDRTGVFEGIYQFGFEESRFWTCDGSVGAWIGFTVAAQRQFDRVPQRPSPMFVYWVRWHGHLRGPERIGADENTRLMVDRILSIHNATRRESENCPLGGPRK